MEKKEKVNEKGIFSNGDWSAMFLDVFDTNAACPSMDVTATVQSPCRNGTRCP
jgi:hypothetical protein